MLGWGDRAPGFMGRVSSRHEEDLVQLQLVVSLTGGNQVTVMDGVKGAAQDAQPLDHGCHSSSRSPMRTVSPDWTPASSSASTTPIALSWR